MVLVDEGNGKDIEFGHTDYHTGEGRPVSHSENQKEWYVNPGLTVKARTRISMRDANRRNQYQIYLLNEHNIRIVESIYYNPFTEDLSLSWKLTGNNGKRILNVTSEER